MTTRVTWNLRLRLFCFAEEQFHRTKLLREYSMVTEKIIHRLTYEACRTWSSIDNPKYRGYINESKEYLSNRGSR
jgi:hypothetical protein